MTPADAITVLTTISFATEPAVPAADPNSMYPKDWWTIIVGVVAGLGGAVIATLTQAWKAKHDQRNARDAALWEYHRVLTDISADMSNFMGDTVEGYDEGPLRHALRRPGRPRTPTSTCLPPMT